MLRFPGDAERSKRWRKKQNQLSKTLGEFLQMNVSLDKQVILKDDTYHRLFLRLAPLFNTDNNSKGTNSAEMYYHLSGSTCSKTDSYVYVTSVCFFGTCLKGRLLRHGSEVELSWFFHSLKGTGEMYGERDSNAIEMVYKSHEDSMHS